MRRVLGLLVFALAIGSHQIGVAQEQPTIKEFPPPTVVMKIERLSQCKGCSAFTYLLYSDMTSKFIGHEAVFRLAESGDYDQMQGKRTSVVRADHPRGRVVVDRRDYEGRLNWAQEPNSPLRAHLNSIIRAGFLELPAGEIGMSDKSASKIRMTIAWEGTTKTVEFPEEPVPAPFAAVWQEVVRHEWFARAIQPTKPFWADNEAQLLIFHMRDSALCTPTMGQTLYRNGRAAIFGWHDGALDRKYREFEVALDENRVREIFAGLSQGTKERYGAPPYMSLTVATQLGDGTGSPSTKIVMIFKANPDAFAGIPRETWAVLRDMWKSAYQRFGPSDPERVAVCARGPVQK